MGDPKKLVRLIVCLMGICFVLALEDTVVQRRVKSATKTRKIQYRTSEGKSSESIAGVAHNVDGSLAPLYDFLVHHKLHTLCKLLRDAGLEQAIKGFGASWTLFVPSDDSFIFLPEGTLEELEGNPSLLRDFILHHFIVGDFPSTHIQNELVVKSAQGSSLRFNVYGKTKTVSGSVILEPDLLFQLGRVHIIDRPLYPIPVEDILTYLQRNHKEMYKFLVDDDVIRYLSGGTYTILAAGDEAFNHLKMELKDKLMTNVTLAQRILLNHILPGSVYVGGITDGMQWKTAGGTYITFTVRRGLTFANGIPIILPDIPFTNGVMHIVNRVLLPEDIEVDCQCEIFGLNRGRAHGSESGSPIASGWTGSLSTLYPKDSGYLQSSYSIPTTLEQQMTKTHEVSHLLQPQSGSMPLQTAGVLVARPSTGQVYQTTSLVPAQASAPAPISQLTTVTRMPISVTGTSTTSKGDTREPLYEEVVQDPSLLTTRTSTIPGKVARRTLYEIVKDPGLQIKGHPVHFTKILELLHKAGLESLLHSPGPMTVFLPSDDAFGSLPKGTIEHLEENPELLRKVLLHHVTHSEILPSQQPVSFIQPSLEGSNLLMTMENGGKRILISGAKAVAITKGSNGILYIINRLLYPLPQHDIASAIKSRLDLTTLAHLFHLSGLEDKLRGQTPYTLLAPTDTAFARLPHPVYDALIRNTTVLQDILRNHIIEGAHYGPEFSTVGTFPSARGGKLNFELNDYGYQVNGINVKTPEIVTGTGVIYLTDDIVFEKPDLDFITAIDNSLAGQQTTGLSLRSAVSGVQSAKQGILQPISSHVSTGLSLGPAVSGVQSATQAIIHPVSGYQSPGLSQISTVSEKRTSTLGIHQPIVGQQPTGLPLRSAISGVQSAKQGILQPISSHVSTGLSLGPAVSGAQSATQAILHPVSGYQSPGLSQVSTVSEKQISTLGIHQPIVGQQTAGLSLGSAISGAQSAAQRILQPIASHVSTGLSLGPAVSGAQSATQTILHPVSGYQSPGLSQVSTVSEKQTSTLGIHQPIVGQQTAGLSLRSAVSGVQSAKQGILQPISSHVSTGLSLGPAVSGAQSATQGIFQPALGHLSTGLSQGTAVSGAQSATQGMLQSVLGHLSTGLPLGSSGSGTQSATQAILHPVSGYQSPGLSQISTVSEKQTSTLGIHQPIVGQQSAGLSLGSAISGVQSAKQGILQPISSHVSSGLSLGSAVSGAQSSTQGIFQPALGHLSTGLPQGTAVSRAQSSTQGTFQPALGHLSTGLSQGTAASGAQSAAQGMLQSVLGHLSTGLSLGSSGSGTQSTTQGILQPISGQQYSHMIHVPSGNLQNIVETSPMLHSLNEAIKSSNIALILSDVGPMTFFAPSDTAFNSLTEKERKGLIKNKNAFTDLLKRHIVRGIYLSDGIKKDTEMKSENDKSIKLSRNEGIFYVNAVPVTYPDNAATNGVLHVIDRFL